MIIKQSNKSPVLIYDKIEKFEPQPEMGRMGTEYAYTKDADLMDFIKHMKAHIKWFQGILDTVFPKQKHMPEPAVRRNSKAGKGKNRSWQQTVDELKSRMDKIEQNVGKGWGWPLPSIEKYNTVVDIVLKEMAKAVDEDVDREEYRVRVQNREQITNTTFNDLFGDEQQAEKVAVDNNPDQFGKNMSVLQDYPVGNTVHYTIEEILKIVEQYGVDGAKEYISVDTFPKIIEDIVARHHKNHW